MNLHSALTQLFIGIATELVSKLRQNELARMHEYDTEHFLFQVRIERKRVTQKIVDARDRLDACKSAAGYNKSQQRREVRARTLCVSLLEMCAPPNAPVNSVD